jgi:microcompartment protein CcmL/EutN
LSLGTIEVLGLPAAIQAADVACKSADVRLIGYETTDGMGMVSVKIEGQVAAVQAAIAAASHAAALVTKVFATSVIPRPSNQLGPVVLTPVTVGLATETSAPAPSKGAPAPEQSSDEKSSPDDESTTAPEAGSEPAEPEETVEPVAAAKADAAPAAKSEPSTDRPAKAAVTRNRGSKKS